MSINSLCAATIIPIAAFVGGCFTVCADRWSYSTTTCYCLYGAEWSHMGWCLLKFSVCHYYYFFFTPWLRGLLWRDSSPSRTIGKLEPSYVIRKFLDAQRIHNLTAYLQTLHLQSLANADHTTLLLNCYTKLKDSSKLEEFIKVMGEGDNLRIVFYFVTIKTRQLKRSSANCKLAPVGLLWERETQKRMDFCWGTLVFVALFPSFWLHSQFGWLAVPVWIVMALASVTSYLLRGG